MRTLLLSPLKNAEVYERRDEAARMVALDVLDGHHEPDHHFHELFAKHVARFRLLDEARRQRLYPARESLCV